MDIVSTIEEILQQSLEQRKEDGLLRKLEVREGLVDFCSNDYLGLARSEELIDRIEQAYIPFKQLGATGSRLLSGNSRLAEELESLVAEFHGAPAALLFNSGYDANLGLLSSVPQRGESIVYDELRHASIRDGIRLSNANGYKFRHNDLESLKDRLKQARGHVFVVVESVYSMTGDMAPLMDLVALCEAYGADLIVDEAHATGVFGDRGEGLVFQLGLTEQVFARVHTFGKAFGCHGAAILGSDVLKQYLINYARSLIYTTALSVHAMVTIREVYRNTHIITDNMLNISKLLSLFKSKIEAYTNTNILVNNSAIQGVLVTGNAWVKEVAEGIQNAGYDVRAILSPTVPLGKERIRICLHAFNTEDELDGLLQAINSQL